MVRLETYGHVPRATGLIRVFVFIRLYEFPRPRVAISRLSRSYLGKNSPPRLANFRGERAICRWGSGKRSDTYALPPSTNSFLPLNVTATVFTHFCSPFPLRFHSLRCALIASPRIRIFRKPNRGVENNFPSIRSTPPRTSRTNFQHDSKKLPSEVCSRNGSLSRRLVLLPPFFQLELVPRKLVYRRRM